MLGMIARCSDQIVEGTFGVCFLARSGTSSRLFTTMFVTGCRYHQTFVQNNQLVASNIQNLFCHKTLQSQVGTFQPDSARKRPHNLHETYQLPSVLQITPDDGHRRCLKHAEFCDKINFGYLIHLVGCFIRSLSLEHKLPPNLIPVWYCWFFSHGKSDQCMNQLSNCHLVVRLQMRGTYHPLPCMSL